MQWIIAVLCGSLMAGAIGRMRRCKGEKGARQLYRRAAWLMGGGVWLAMLAQEWMLWRSGMLSWATGLPLHLCSAMGVLTLPMLLTESTFLWHTALYAGMPGAAMALLFPAVADTAYPWLTRCAFCTMHALILLSPLLPLGLGRKPKPSGALQAGIFLVLLGSVAMIANRLSKGNYLFLAGAIPGTPLTLLSQGAIWRYRARLALLAALVLAGEGMCVGRIRRHGEKNAKNALRMFTSRKKYATLMAFAIRIEGRKKYGGKQ